MNSIKKKILEKTPWITSPKVLIDISVSMSHMENLCGKFKIFVLSGGFCTH